MEVITDRERIDQIFSRGIVSEILPTKEEFLHVLYSGKKLRIYIGADATSSSLHLSHAKNYMFLEELRRLGHEVIVLVGDFTAMIGDPTGRNDARPKLTEQEVAENVKSWLAQIRPLMDFDAEENAPKVMFNSEWLSKLTFTDVVKLASQFTVQQILERDMFEKRLEEGKPIFLHEFLYPLMQGYDSVAMDVDVELCGTDQIFNALAGRVLVERYNHHDKFVVALNLMANPKTGELMSKSRGNGVFLSSGPSQMFGEIMAQPDEMTEVLFTNNTRIPLGEKDAIMSLGPRDAKARVAHEIVRIFYGAPAAEKAEADFVETFSNKGIPSDIESVEVEAGKKIADVLLGQKIIESKSEWRRLVEEGAVSDAESGEKITSADAVVEKSAVLKVGKRRFLRIELI